MFVVVMIYVLVHFISQG